MGRARRARKIAATAAYGGGIGAAGIGALGLVGYGVLKVEAMLARRIVGKPFEGAPDDDGRYGSGLGFPVQFVVLGDSSAAGMGADTAQQTVGAIIAHGLSALSGRPVQLTNVAVIGAESSGLNKQLANVLERVDNPDVAIILIGANSNRPSAHFAPPTVRSSSEPVPIWAPSSRWPSHYDYWRVAGVETWLRPRRLPWSRPGAARSPWATCSAHSSPRSRRTCSATTGSILRRPATRGWRRLCCPASATRWACGQVRSTIVPTHFAATVSGP